MRGRVGPGRGWSVRTAGRGAVMPSMWALSGPRAVVGAVGRGPSHHGGAGNSYG